jgi:hypothetical protein
MQNTEGNNPSDLILQILDAASLRIVAVSKFCP